MVEPPEPSDASRRKYPRARLTFLVQLRFPDFETFAREWAQNLSVGGLYLQTENPHDEGTLVVVRFTLASGGTLIEALARVVHKAKDGMGLEFVQLDEASRQVIDEVVTRS